MISSPDAEIKTSISSPIIITPLETPGGGKIGMTFCPGKKQLNAATGNWNRNLDTDLAVIRAWEAAAVVTLMETSELVDYGVAEIGVKVVALGMQWHHLPIIDGDIPRRRFESKWAASGPVLRDHLLCGRRILLHCRGGLGRTGTISARLLIELGIPANTAIDQVRFAKPKAIENLEQESYVHSLEPIADGIIRPAPSGARG